MAHIRRFNYDTGKYELFRVKGVSEKVRKKKNNLKKIFKYFILAILLVFFILSVIFIIYKSGFTSKKGKKPLIPSNNFNEQVS